MLTRHRILLASSLLLLLAVNALRIGPDDIALVVRLITAYRDYPQLVKFEEAVRKLTPEQGEGGSSRTSSERKHRKAPPEEELSGSDVHVSSKRGSTGRRKSSGTPTRRTKTTSKVEEEKSSERRSSEVLRKEESGERKGSGLKRRRKARTNRRPLGPRGPDTEVKEEPSLESLGREALELKISDLRVPHSVEELAKLDDGQLCKLLAVEDHDVRALFLSNLGKLFPTTDLSPSHIPVVYLQLLDPSLDEEDRGSTWSRYLRLPSANVFLRGLEAFANKRRHAPLQFTPSEAADVADAIFRVHWEEDRKGARQALEKARGALLEFEPGEGESFWTLGQVEAFIDDRRREQQARILVKETLPEDWSPPSETELANLSGAKLQALQRLPQGELRRLLVSHPDLVPEEEEGTFSDEGVRENLRRIFAGLSKHAGRMYARDLVKGRLLSLWSSYLARALQDVGSLKAVLAWNESDRGATRSSRWEDYHALAAHVYAGEAKSSSPRDALQALAPPELKEMAGTVGNKASGELTKDMELLLAAQERRAQERLEEDKELARKQRELFQKESVDREQMLATLLKDMPITYRAREHEDEISKNVEESVLTYLYVMQKRDPQDAPLARALLNQWQVLPRAVDLGTVLVTVKEGKGESSTRSALAYVASLWLARGAFEPLLPARWAAVAKAVALRGPFLSEALLTWTGERAGADLLSQTDLEAIAATAYRLYYEQAPERALRVAARAIGEEPLSPSDMRYPWLGDLHAALAVIAGDQPAMVALLKARLPPVTGCPIPEKALRSRQPRPLLLLLHATMSDAPLAPFLVRRLPLVPNDPLTGIIDWETAARGLLLGALRQHCHTVAEDYTGAPVSSLVERIGKLAIEQIGLHLPTVEAEQCVAIARSSKCTVALTLANHLLLKVDG